jgi:general secretion pathway protein B
VSYILEALRRADSERDRGAVPGLGAQAFARTDDADAPPASWRLPLWAWLAVGMVLACALGWYRWSALDPDAAVSGSGGAQTTSVATRMPPQTATELPAVVDANGLQTASAAVAAAATTPDESAAVELPALAPPQSLSPPIIVKALAPEKRSEKQPEKTQRRPVDGADAEFAVNRNDAVKPPPIVNQTPVAVTALPGEQQQPPSAESTVVLPPMASNPKPVDNNTTTAKVAAAVLPAPVAPLLRYQDLPPALRGQLPALSISGSVYAPQAKNRVLILNGQLFHEGEEPSAGLKIQHIKLKSAILQFQGQLFEMGY